MPDVGTLSLTIESNAGQAAKGLGDLAKALEKVQKAVGTGLDMSGVAGQITALSAAVSGSEKTLASMGTFVNAISNYTNAIGKLKSAKINTQPIEDIKEAVKGGFGIGQAGTQINKLREALAGEWNTENASYAGIAMQEIATGASALKDSSASSTISATSKSLQDFASAMKELSGSDMSFDPFGQILASMQDVVNVSGEDFKSIGVNFATGIAVGIQEGTPAVVEAGRAMANALSAAVKETLDIHSPSGEGEYEGMQYVKGVVQGIEETSGEAQEAAASMAEAIVASTQSALQTMEMLNASGEIANSTGGISNETIGEIANVSKSVIDLTKIPSSGLNGPFKSAAEEVEYFTSEIDRAKSDLAEWENIYSKAEKAIKYQGESEDRSRELRYAEEGFFDAYSRIDKNESYLSQALTYANGYAEFMNQAAKASAAQALNIESVVSSMQQIESSSITPLLQRDKSPIADLLTGKFGQQNQMAAVQRLSEITGLSMDNISKQISDFMGYQSKIQDVSDPIKNVEETATSAAPAVKNLEDATAGVNAELQSMSFLKEVVYSFKSGFEEGADAVKEASKEVSKLKQELDNIKNGVGKLGIAKLFKQVLGRARMMAIRSAIRTVTAAFKEGVENVYNYSKAVGTSFAPAMDSAASAIALMKNSIGAALAPAIQALIPILQTVVSWVITAVNYLNQFFALLNGQSTWTKAIDAQTTAFNKNKKAAGGAGKAAKDLLADWDELNIIQSQNGGGGGGGGGTNLDDYKNMFEEVGEYAKWVKDLVAGINEQFGSIWSLVGRIAAVLLTWKVSKAFAGVIGTIGAILAAAGIIDLTFNLVTMFDNKFFDTGEEGWLIANVLTTIIGAVLTKQVLGSVIKGNAAHVGVSLLLAVSAMADIFTYIGRNDVSALSKEGLEASILGALKMGGAAAYLAKMTMGKSIGTSLKGGLAIALLTFGATVGIKATVQAIKSGVTVDTVKAAALSSLAIGLGAGLLAKITGVGTMGAIAFGAVSAGAAIATMAVAIGVTALLSLLDRNPVKWGNYSATEKEIKSFVEGQVFTVSPETVISIIDPVIEASSSSDEGLKTTVSEVKLQVSKLKIGLNDEDSTIKEIEKLVFGEEGKDGGLIGKFNESARNKQAVIETGILLMPTATNDDGSSKEVIEMAEGGWELLNGRMAELGNNLRESLFKAYSDGLTADEKKAELKTIQELTTMITNVSEAMSQGAAREQGLQLLGENLASMDMDSYSRMFDYIDEYKKQLKDSFKKAYEAVTTELASQRAGVLADMNNVKKQIDEALAAGNDEEAGRLQTVLDEYTERYDWLTDEIAKRRKEQNKKLDDAVNASMSQETKDYVRDVLSSIIDKNAVKDFMINEGDNAIGAASAEARITMWSQLFNSNGEETAEAKAIFGNWITGLMTTAFGGENALVLTRAISEGMLGYDDVINTSVIDAIAESIGISDQSPEIQEAWNKFINELLQLDEENAYKFTIKAEPVIEPVNAEKNVKETISEIDEVFNELSTFIGMSGVSGQGMLTDIVAMRENGNLEGLKAYLEMYRKAFGTEENGNVEMPEVESTAYENSLQDVKNTTQETVDDINAIFEELSGYLQKEGISGLGMFDQANAMLQSGNIEGLKEMLNTYRELYGVTTEAGNANVGSVKNWVLKNGGVITGGMGVSDVGFTRWHEENEATVSEHEQPAIDYTQMATSVANGASTANASVVSELQTLVSQLTRLLNKQWVVNVSPSASGGRWVQQSGDALSRVQG